MAEKFATRLDLKTGFACNNNCLFCVASDKRAQGDRTKEEIVSDLRSAYGQGAREVVFTGGEVTIRKDLVELVSFAKGLGYKTIQVQTNGRMLSYPDLVTGLVEAGATEFSPAIHGHIPQLHDFLTQKEGSFSQTIRGLKNIRESGIPIITNTVITKPNYQYLPEISRLLIGLGVDQFQLAFVHPIGNALKNFDGIVPFKSLVRPFVHRSLDIARSEGVRAMVEAYPFCFMEGYEDCCSERYIPHTEIREFGTRVDFTKVRANECKQKSAGCKECMHFEACEGPWNEYVERRGWVEFIPVTKVSDRRK